MTDNIFPIQIALKDTPILVPVEIGVVLFSCQEYDGTKKIREICDAGIDNLMHLMDGDAALSTTKITVTDECTDAAYARHLKICKMYIYFTLMYWRRHHQLPPRYAGYNFEESLHRCLWTGQYLTAERQLTSAFDDFNAHSYLYKPLYE